MSLLDMLTPYIPHILLGCVAVSLILYTVLDGFDLGVGILSLFERNSSRREEMMESIATVWDGNESWLVLLGAVLFAGFPLAFGIVLPALYVPLILMIVFLTFRGVAFEFQVQHSRHNRLWGYSFAIGSLGAAFMQGIALGAFMDGISFSDDTFTGGTFDFLSPLSLATGVLVVAVYTLSGAGWLVYKFEGELLTSARRWGKLAILAALVAALLVMVLVSVYSPASEVMGEFSVQSFIVFAAFGVALAALFVTYFTFGGRDGLKPFGLSALATVGLVGGFLAMVYPAVILPGVTIKEAVAPVESAWLLTVVILPLIPVTVAYNGIAYYLFRGKQVRHEGQGNETSTQGG